VTQFKPSSYCEAVARDGGLRHTRRDIVARLRAEGLVSVDTARNGHKRTMCDLTAYLDLARQADEAIKRREAEAQARRDIAQGKRLERQRELFATREWARQADDDRQAALDEAKRLREEVADLRARVNTLEQAIEARQNIVAWMRNP
jgi:predicted nuclease with TOPRIM domain